MPIPLGTQFQLFLKILLFNRTAVVKDQLVILIVYQKNFRVSLNTLNEIKSLNRDNLIGDFNGKPVRLESVSIENELDLETYLLHNKPDVIYIPPLRAIDIKMLAKIATEIKVLTLTGVPDYVKFGVTIGVDIKGEKPEIMINLRSAKESGADFSSQLLKLSRIVN